MPRSPNSSPKSLTGKSSLANHALDFGAEALLDTFEHLRAAGIDWVVAGADRERARSHVMLESDVLRLAVFGCSDHPAAYAAGAQSPGIASGLEWLPQAGKRADAGVVSGRRTG